MEQSDENLSLSARIEKHGKSRVSPEEVSKIRALVSAGNSIKKVAEMTGRGPTLVRKIAGGYDGVSGKKEEQGKEQGKQTPKERDLTDYKQAQGELTDLHKKTSRLDNTGLIALARKLDDANMLDTNEIVTNELERRGLTDWREFEDIVNEGKTDKWKDIEHEKKMRDTKKKGMEESVERKPYSESPHGKLEGEFKNIQKDKEQKEKEFNDMKEKIESYEVEMTNLKGSLKASNKERDQYKAELKEIREQMIKMTESYNELYQKVNAPKEEKKEEPSKEPEKEPSKEEQKPAEEPKEEKKSEYTPEHTLPDGRKIALTPEEIKTMEKYDSEIRKKYKDNEGKESTFMGKVVKGQPLDESNLRLPKSYKDDKSREDFELGLYKRTGNLKFSEIMKHIDGVGNVSGMRDENKKIVSDYVKELDMKRKRKEYNTKMKYVSGLARSISNSFPSSEYDAIHLQEDYKGKVTGVSLDPKVRRGSDGMSDKEWDEWTDELIKKTESKLKKSGFNLKELEVNVSEKGFIDIDILDKDGNRIEDPVDVEERRLDDIRWRKETGRKVKDEEWQEYQEWKQKQESKKNT